MEHPDDVFLVALADVVRPARAKSFGAAVRNFVLCRLFSADVGGAVPAPADNDSDVEAGVTPVAAAAAHGDDDDEGVQERDGFLHRAAATGVAAASFDMSPRMAVWFFWRDGRTAATATLSAAIVQSEAVFRCAIVTVIICASFGLFIGSHATEWAAASDDFVATAKTAARFRLHLEPSCNTTCGVSYALLACVALYCVYCCWKTVLVGPGYIGVGAVPGTAAGLNESLARLPTFSPDPSATPAMIAVARPLSATVHCAKLGRDVEVIRKPCQTCRLLRPPRAGHCAATGSCVAEFDHFCGVLGCAVGRRNVKHFIRFLSATATLALLLLFVTFVGIAHMSDVELKSNGAVWATMALGIFSVLPLFAFVLNFLYVRCYRGMTLRESRKRGELYRGLELEEDWQRVPAPYSAGSVLGNLLSLCM